MGLITRLLTRTDDSAGRQKADRRPVPNLDEYLSATELNNVLDAVVALLGTIGLGDGSTVGSHEARLNMLETEAARLPPVVMQASQQTTNATPFLALTWTPSDSICALVKVQCIGIAAFGDGYGEYTAFVTKTGGTVFVASTLLNNESHFEGAQMTGLAMPVLSGSGGDLILTITGNTHTITWSVKLTVELMEGF